MSTDNLSIWNAAKKTDTRFTKSGKQDGRQITSINHIGMVEKATEMWGPIGIMWGYEIVEERDDKGRPILVNGEPMGHDITHTLRLRLWYEIDGKRGSVENYGHTPRVYFSQKGGYWVEDKEAAKKSLTDAFKKCMSFLGFSADIYSGEWDDPEYRREREMESQVERAEDKDAARDGQAQELKDYVQRNLATILSSKKIPEAAGVYKVAMRHLERQKTFPHLREIAEKGVTAISREYETLKSQLEGNK